MRRSRQALDKAAITAILKQQPRGVLSVIGDEGYPYAVPMNFWYCEEDGMLYFHGGKAGHRIDALRRCNKACFCIYDEGFRKEGDWALTFGCVVIFGQIHFVEEYERAMEVSRCLSRKFTQDEAYIDQEISSFGQGTVCFALEVEHITGKQVHEA
jgi:nitroimidazol reductase NimA-like FMN-containing flavoprotein (pyridoxamine 5'-phosphate oxidase superfamily)